MPYDGKLMEKAFVIKVLLALVPPLVLIFAVLGSIIAGIATVNQAGAIGAIGATIMAGYRLREGEKDAFHPAILAIVSLVAILVLMSVFDLNIRTIETSADKLGILLCRRLVIVADLQDRGHIEWCHGRERQDNIDGFHHSAWCGNADCCLPWFWR